MRLDHITLKQIEVFVDKQCVISRSKQVLFSFRIFYAGLIEDVDSVNPNDLPGGNSKWEPPDPISNSEVKLLSADDSVGLPHVKVGHCQALTQNPDFFEVGVFSFVSNLTLSNPHPKKSKAYRSGKFDIR